MPQPHPPNRKYVIKEIQHKITLNFFFGLSYTFKGPQLVEIKNVGQNYKLIQHERENWRPMKKINEYPQCRHIYHQTTNTNDKIANKLLTHGPEFVGDNYKHEINFIEAQL